MPPAFSPLASPRLGQLQSFPSWNRYKYLPPETGPLTDHVVTHERTSGLKLVPRPMKIDVCQDRRGHETQPQISQVDSRITRPTPHFSEGKRPLPHHNFTTND